MEVYITSPFRKLWPTDLVYAIRKTYGAVKRSTFLGDCNGRMAQRRYYHHNWFILLKQFSKKARSFCNTLSSVVSIKRVSFYIKRTRICICIYTFQFTYNAYCTWKWMQICIHIFSCLPSLSEAHTQPALYHHLWCNGVGWGEGG